VKMTTHLYLVPKLRKRGDIPLLPHTSSQGGTTMRVRGVYLVTLPRATCLMSDCRVSN